MILTIASLLLIVPADEAELGWGTKTVTQEKFIRWESDKKHC